MQNMPSFNEAEYANLLSALQEAGYRLSPVTTMAADDGTTRYAFIRHDIDIHLPGIEPIAQAEADLGVSSTYYILLTQHYNPLYPENRRVIRGLVEMGHEIGLHYDLQTYPRNRSEALAHLDEEAALLSAVAGVSVRTVSMHQPYGGLPDVAQSGTSYIHPHDPDLGADLLYVSDSCRAWRDTALLRCFVPEEAPRRLLLLTHPELWLDGSVRSRTDYLEKVLLTNACRQAGTFVDKAVRAAWKRHPGPTEHDRRGAGDNDPVRAQSV